MYTIIIEQKDDIQHSAKGTTWKNHKYIRKEDDRYIYPDDKRSGVSDKIKNALGEDEKERKNQLESESLEADREYAELSEIADRKWKEYYDIKNKTNKGEYFDKDNPNFLQDYYNSAMAAEIKKAEAGNKSSEKRKQYNQAVVAYDGTVSGIYESVRKKGQIIIDKILRR